jgi:NitT/TauT family transport system permease protein
MTRYLTEINKKFISLYMVIAFFLLWEIAPRSGWANPHFFPPFSEVLITAKQVTYWQLFIDIMVSLKRILIGFLLASALALPVGFILGGAFPKVARFLNSLLNFLAQVPAFILFPVFVVIFGIGETGILVVISWAAFWPILFTTIQGVRQVDPILIKGAKSMGANPLTIFWKVVIPGALASILTGMRTGMTISFMMLIGAETLGANSGLGWLIHNSTNMGFIPRIYLAVILIAVLGLGINYFLEWIERKMITWKEVAPEKML